MPDKLTLPSPDELVVTADGKINPRWYVALKAIVDKLNRIP